MISNFALITRIVQKGSSGLPIALACLAVAALVGGCGSPAGQASSGSTTTNLTEVLAQASAAGKPIALLIFESAHSRADDDARALLKTASIKLQNAGVLPVLLDIVISRNRAAAARFHLTNTPALLCLSPEGLIISHDESPINAGLLSERMGEILRKATELDSKAAALAKAVSQSSDGAKARFELADFFLSRQNAREAIPRLEFVAYDESADPALRIRAWVALARAHIWIAEPEKGRHEAKDLIATLGPNAEEAIAAGNLVLGIQDATAKQNALARQEFEAAVAASPDSTYGQQAADELVKLSGGAK